MKIYRVGGYVRDKLLEIKSDDIDYEVVGSSVDEMLQLGYKIVGNDFPVFLHPTTGEEYALARTEKKVSIGYNGFSFDFNPNITLEESLKRRDLTINAMALDDNDNLIDYFNGKEDLDNKVLRHIQDSFREDPVRVLRVCRFSAKFNFQIHESTMDLMKDMVKSGELNYLTSERVFKELQKVLSTKHIRNFFDNLDECGALEIIFPEVYNLIGVPQTKKYHGEVDTYEHLMMCLQVSVENYNLPDVVFATLCHDFGKALTPIEVLPKHIGHEFRGIKLVESFCNRLRVPATWKELALKTSEYHTKFHKIHLMRPAKVVNLLYDIDAFRKPSILKKLLQVSYNDTLGKCSVDKSEAVEQNISNKYFLLECYDICVNTDFSDIVSKYSGKVIGDRIRDKRLNLVKQLKNKP
jgi:tRNA nucleotidyltransferase (CCA-adding enzyme)